MRRGGSQSPGKSSRIRFSNKTSPRLEIQAAQICPLLCHTDCLYLHRKSSNNVHFFGAACCCLLFKAASTILGSTASLVFGALSYSQGAARLMIPSTTISCARTWSLCAHRGQGPGIPRARSYAACSPSYNAFRLRQEPFPFLSLKKESYSQSLDRFPLGFGWKSLGPVNSDQKLGPEIK